MHPAARIAAIGTYLPETTRTTAETEHELRSRNPQLTLSTGLVSRATGVERVHVREAGWQTSDLAAAAARSALERSPGPVDLVLFASASQDLIEPATSHIVSAKLGLGAPVMDIKNACNSVLNALEVGEALIRSGRYRRVLVASGEQPSNGVRWQLESRGQFLRSFAGYTMSDGGAAIVLEATDDSGVGILASDFHAASQHWQVGTVPAGGSMHPRSLDASYFDMDGAGLMRAFLELGPEPIRRFLRRIEMDIADFDLIAFHQVSVPSIGPVLARMGVPAERIVVTVGAHGNLASVTLPLQLQYALDRGMIGAGSAVLLIGLAGGISLGLMAVRL